MQQRRNRVQWVYAAKNNQELETRYDQWAPEYDKDLAEQFEWVGPGNAIALFAKHVPTDAKLLDAVISVGVFTTGHAPAHAFDELARITKPGGFIVFSLRTELYDEGGFRETLADLEAAGRWCLAERSEPYQPLRKGEPEVAHRIWVYRVMA